MKPIVYEKVAITPIPQWDGYLIEWARRKFLQIRIFNGKIHIKFNGLKVFKTMEVDGIEFEAHTFCKDCLLKYGKKIKTRKSLLGWWYICFQCAKEIL